MKRTMRLIGYGFGLCKAVALRLWFFVVFCLAFAGCIAMAVAVVVLLRVIVAALFDV